LKRPAMALAFLLCGVRTWAFQVPPVPPEPPVVGLPGRTPQPLVRSPSTVTLITADQVRLSGARFLSDVLRLVPGLEVQRVSPTGCNVAARGYNDDSSSSQGMLCLVDGRQVYNEFYGSVLWDALPVSLEDIERIEVIRGPGSFLYGPNAMHGVINIVTRSALKCRKVSEAGGEPGPAAGGKTGEGRKGQAEERKEPVEDEEVSVSAAGGTYSSYLARASYIRRERDSAFKAILVRDDINEFEPRDRNTMDKSFLELRYERVLGDGEHRMEVAGGLNRQKMDVLIPMYSVVPTANFSNEVIEGFLRAGYEYGNFKGRVSWTRFRGDSVPDLVYAPFTVNLDTADVDLQYSLDLGGQTVTAGTGYRFAVFETSDEDVADGRHDTGLAWGFVQDELELFGGFWITGGVRWDHHSIAGNAVSPRLAAVWEFEENQSLRASAGYGFRNPSLRELWFAMPISLGVVTTGNEDLRPEQMRSFEIGYRGLLPLKVLGEFSLYYNLIDRLVEYRQTGPTTLGPGNVNQEEAYGAEGSVEYVFIKELSAFANGSWGIRQDRDTDDRIPYSPRFKGNAGLRLTLPDLRMTAMAWVTRFGKIEIIDPAGGTSMGEVDDYTMLNGRVQWDLMDGRLRIFAHGFNVADHDHREHPLGQSYGFLGLVGVEWIW